MTQGLAGPTRRALLALGAGSAASLRPAAAAPPESASLVVAGPEDAPAAQWAARVGAGLGRLLPQAAVLRLQVVGGGDGIAAANRFATAAAPDGRTLLALSGTAAQARAAGDSRVRFDPGIWLPLCGAAQAAVLAGRGPLPQRGTTFRIALSNPDSSDAAALLALDALGVAAAPVFGIPPAAAEAALAQGAADAALLLGPGLPDRLVGLGVQPWIAAEPIGGGREPTLPDVPTLGEVIGAAPVLGACQLGFAAFRMRGLVVLPALTTGDALAGWRSAGRHWFEEEIREPAVADRPLDTMQTGALLATLCPPPAAVQAYRDWLARRLNWRAV